MDTRKYYAYNQTRGCFLIGGLDLVDAGLEPLKVLKILIEGLAPNAKTGLWLTHFRSVPVARTLSPFDLAYLDSEHRVVHSVELSTDGEFAPFKGQPASALVLPAQSISSSKTRTGDQLIIRAVEDTAHKAAPSLKPVETPQPPPIQQAPKANLPDATFHEPPGDSTVSPLEQFLARQSSIAVGHGRVQPGTKSLLELSPGAHPSIQQIPTPGAQNAPAVADPPNPSRPSARVMPVPGPQTLEPRSEPPRIARVSPLRAPSTVEPPTVTSAAPATPTPARQVRPPRPKVEQFPSRALTPPVSDNPPKGTDPVPQSLEMDEGPTPQSQEKLSLLMRVLRLQFLSRDRKARRNLALPRPQAVEEPTPKTKTVPSWVLRALRWMYPEFEISTEPQVKAPQAYTSKTKFQREEKPSLDMQFMRWLYPELNFRRPPCESPPIDRRLAGRLQKPGLVAYYFTGGPPRAHNLGNISVTGFYMHTDERWMPGTIIRMTLQLIDTRGEEPTDTLTVHSRVVRWGPDGEGFEFVLAGFLDEPLPVSYRKSERPRHRSDS